MFEQHYSKQPQSGNNPSADEKINKCGISMQYNLLSYKKDDILMHATMCTDFDNLILNERHQAVKTTCCPISFI
jgi:hypothetical protein